MKAHKRQNTGIDFETEKDHQLSEEATNRVLGSLETESVRRYRELEWYMHPFRPYRRLLSRAELLELHRQFRSGPTQEARLAARDEIVYRNIRLVLSIALKRSGHGLDLLDRLQEGYFGLNKAIEKFEPEKGYAFSTYATWWIRQSITRAIADLNTRSTMRLPVHVQEKLFKVRKHSAMFHREHGRWPTDLELFYEIRSSTTSDNARLSLQEVVELHRMWLDRGISLNTPAYVHEDDGSGGEIQDYLPAKQNVESVIEAKRLLEKFSQAKLRIEKAVDDLAPRTAMVLRLRLGLGDFDLLTLEEIGQRYEVTRERIRQIEAKGFEALKQTLGGVEQDEIVRIVEAVEELKKIAAAI